MLLMHILTSILIFHPHFVSVTKINHNWEEKRLEITHRIFTDDLERTISFHEAKKVDLLTDSLYEENFEFIRDYIFRHVFIENNNQVLNIKVLGFEKDEEAILIYSEVECTKPEQVKVRIDLLTEIISTQVNIVHFKTKEKMKSTQLSKSKTEVIWIFKS